MTIDFDLTFWSPLKGNVTPGPGVDHFLCEVVPINVTHSSDSPIQVPNQKPKQHSKGTTKKSRTKKSRIQKTRKSRTK